jgi:integrase
MEARYVVALHTGLRQGDLLALHWEDVDIEEKALMVRRTITKDGGKLLIGPPRPLMAGGRSSSPQTPPKLSKST